MGVTQLQAQEDWGVSEGPARPRIPKEGLLCYIGCEWGERRLSGPEHAGGD